MGEIAEKSESEIAVPQINLEHIQTVGDGAEYLNKIFPSIRDEHQKQIYELFEKKEKKLRKIDGRGLSRILNPLIGAHYEISEKDAYSSTPEEKEIEKRVKSFGIMDFYAPELIRAGAYPTTIEKDVKEIQGNLEVFLRYLFPTPTNRSAGKKEWNEIVPVEESVLFGLYKHFVQFQKSGREEFAQMAEDMKLIGTVLPEEYADYYIKKTENSISTFNKDMEAAAKSIRTAGLCETKENKDLNMDIEIANYAIRKIRESKGAQKGVYAILLDTSIGRIESYLNKEIERFCKSLNEIKYLHEWFPNFLKETKGYCKHYSLDSFVKKI